MEGERNEESIALGRSMASTTRDLALRGNSKTPSRSQTESATKERLAWCVTLVCASGVSFTQKVRRQTRAIAYFYGCIRRKEKKARDIDLTYLRVERFHRKRRVERRIKDTRKIKENDPSNACLMFQKKRAETRTRNTREKMKTIIPTHVGMSTLYQKRKVEKHAKEPEKVRKEAWRYCSPTCPVGFTREEMYKQRPRMLLKRKKTIAPISARVEQAPCKQSTTRQGQPVAETIQHITHCSDMCGAEQAPL